MWHTPGVSLPSQRTPEYMTTIEEIIRIAIAAMHDRAERYIKDAVFPRPS